MNFPASLLKHFKPSMDLFLGVLIMGGNGAVIGYIIGGPLVIALGVFLGSALGAFISTLQARVFFVSVLTGMFIGGMFSVLTGRPETLTVTAGSGAAIGGFIGVNIDLYRKGGNQKN